MDPRPPNWLILITGLIHWQCATVQTTYIIDNVGLSLLPSSSVDSGTNVTLVCEVSISQDSSSYPPFRFHFIKNDQVISRLDTQEDRVAYELHPARAADTGSYGCHVNIEEKSKSSQEKTLTVTGLQKPILHLNATSIFESEDVLASCSAPSEKGALVFFFYQRFRSGDTQEVKRATSTGNSLETKLGLRHIGDSHIYCDYELPLVGRSNHSNQVQVTVKRMFIDPTMNILPSSEVYEGDVIEVVCKVVGAPRDVEVNVFLIKDRKILRREPVSLSHRFRAKDGDSGELVCKAESGALQKETYMKITVKELISKPRLIVEPLDLFEGDFLKMTCSVSIYVPDRIQNSSLRYSIYKERTQVHQGSVYNISADASVNGKYSCRVQASSSTGSFIKESTTEIVIAKVPVSKPTMRVVGGTLILGKPFQLICYSEKGSLPISYTLHGPKNYKEVKVITRPLEAGVFNVTVSKSSDLNNFLCLARNHKKLPPETANQLLTSTIIIEPVSKPILTSVPDMGDITERHDVTLYCSVLRGSPPVTFTWYRAESRTLLVSETSTKLKASHVIRLVGTDHNGGYYCTATNSANATKNSDVLTIAVKMAGWKKALIAIVCLLLLVALILVVTFKKRLISFKRKRGPELSVKSAGTKIERLSLTQSEVVHMANATPSMMGKSVWSEHVSGSESDNESGVVAPKTPELDYAEVQTKQPDPSRAPVKKGTDTTYSEVRHSTQGAPEAADSQASVEYAELNHDAEAQSGGGNHDDHTDTVQEESRDGTCGENCETNDDTGGPGGETTET
ncbi:LOW QUALITY PROTEIN: platelet endothelial cell adhesion molecule [Boleophthalmus pectinirostris]|uniref:LOW QUALITY PROTEIN: platelet endothelial cell adhesion molecule n=1 Tax=Boleophthalmus pectinirostris TaxID=150288 RepID=UPI0024329515|nr:LOW QUALITY PROTEIN: platelet endothelial cell adhesion molecule [Boleophthalmus pectinirostris]